MKRISTLGLGAVLALALTASVGAASASASGFVANGDPLYAHVTGTASGTQTMTLGGTIWECSKADLDGEFEKPSTSLAPSLSEMQCGPGARNIKPNGCKFIFHPGEKQPEVYGEPETFKGTVEIGPPGCGPMTTTGHLGSATKIFPKTGLNATYTNASGTPDTVTVTLNTSALKYIEPFWSGQQVKENGTFYGKWTIKADRLGSATDLAVETDIPLPIGLGNVGGKSAFEADSYPIDVHSATKATASAEWKFLSGALAMKCSFVDYGFSLSGPTSERLASAVNSGCKAGTLPTKVEMNGCQYRFTLTSVGSGTDDIICPQGKVITLNVYASKAGEEEGKTICRVDLGSQSKGTIANALSNLGFITMDTAMSGLKYTYTRLSAVCPGSTGTFENGSFNHQVKLVGFE